MCGQSKSRTEKKLSQNLMSDIFESETDFDRSTSTMKYV